MTLSQIKNSSIYFSEGVLRIGSGLLEKHFIVLQIGSRLPEVPRMRSQIENSLIRFSACVVQSRIRSPENLLSYNHFTQAPPESL